MKLLEAEWLMPYDPVSHPMFSITLQTLWMGGLLITDTLLTVSDLKAINGPLLRDYNKMEFVLIVISQ